MGRPNWDDYFIRLAKTVAERSEDPSSQVGCVIVTQDNEPISFGYNGFTRGCNEHGQTFERPMKYHLVIHAEMNAILFAKRDLHGAKLYCTHAPCDNCLKHILQSGIRYIVFEDTELLSRLSDESLEASLRLAMSHDIVITKNSTKQTYIDVIKNEQLCRKNPHLFVQPNGDLALRRYGDS